MAVIESVEIAWLGPRLERGELPPGAVLDEVYRRIEAAGVRPIFVELLSKARAREILRGAEARRRAGERLPLFGIPFAIKDNIDFAELPTTAGCPAFSYQPKQSAVALQRLIDAGAIPVGKTNLDQFATGLVGTRTPYGVCASAFDGRYLSGGSSSGSGVAVARGLVSFALGTDTAGSGRVPAAFNNLIGVKPTRGLVSTSGVVPACRSLDCVSVFAGSVPDAELVLGVLEGFDPADSLSRARGPGAGPIERLGVPASLEWYGDAEYARLFRETVERAGALGVRCVPVDLEPFLAAALLLYGGPWVAERYAAVGEFIAAHPDETHPVVREIILSGAAVTGPEVFRGHERLAELSRATEAAWKTMDALLLPTTPTHPTIEAALADPVELNARLGRYTNFVNLLDLAALAVPAGFTREGRPFGVTLIGRAFSDERLLELGDRLHRSLEPSFGATGVKLEPRAEPPVAARDDEIVLAVAGAHLRGLPLSGELTSRGARYLSTTRTAAHYRFYALAGTVPAKPGLVRSPGFAGPGIEVELWALPRESFGAFVAGVPAPMVIGTVTLADGSSVKGFLCEPYALEGSEEITALGGFRRFLERKSSS